MLVAAVVMQLIVLRVLVEMAEAVPEVVTVVLLQMQQLILEVAEEVPLEIAEQVEAVWLF
jgi:hypothetical protein